MKGLEFVKITKVGNELYKGFTFDSEFFPFGRDRGFEYLFAVSSYYFGKANAKTLEIAEYCEGDVFLTKCRDRESFLKELTGLKDWLETQGYEGEAEEVQDFIDSLE